MTFSTHNDTINSGSTQGNRIAFEGYARLYDAQFPITRPGECKDDLTHKQIMRRMRIRAKQITEIAALCSGLIHKNGSQYCTTFAARERLFQRHKWAIDGAKKEFSSADGSVKFTLADIISKNRRRKTAELYARIAGLSAAAEAAGLSWSAWTLTAPPEFHPNPSNGAGSWDGSTPLEAHRWIAENFALLRARLAKIDVRLIGLRVAEPHGDACSHWHAAIYYDPAAHENIVAEIRKIWPDEAAAKEEIGDPKRGKFASYMFKYILKAVSAEEENDNYDPEFSDDFSSIQRVDAWRSIWQVRSYQFFGLPGIGVWRGMRKQSFCPTDPLLSGIWHAAKRGDGLAYINLMGGLGVKNSTRPAKTITAEQAEQINLSIKKHNINAMSPEKYKKYFDLMMRLKMEPRQTCRISVINLPKRGETTGVLLTIKNTVVWLKSQKWMVTVKPNYPRTSIPSAVNSTTEAEHVKNE